MPSPVVAPGSVLGTTEAKWILPYVRLRKEGVFDPETADRNGCCCGGRMSVEWFSRDGEPMFEIGDVGTGLGFLRKLEPAEESATDDAASTDRGERIIGLDPYWELDLPKKGVRSRYITATPTTHVFLHLYHPTDTDVAVDVYRTGTLAETVGPFPDPGRTGVRLADSGAFAVTLGSYEQGALIEIVLVDPSGRQSRPFSIDSHGSQLVTDPTGRGIVYQANDRHKYWAEPGEAPVRLDVWGNNSRVLGWSGNRALFHEWSEDGMRFSLVDLRSGESMWKRPAIDWAQRHGGAVLDRAWIYLYEWEPDDERGRGGGHDISVLDLESGDLLHVWRSSRGARRISPPLSPARLLAIRGEIYFLTEAEFARIDRSDVESHVGGWDDPHAPTR